LFAGGRTSFVIGRTHRPEKVEKKIWNARLNCSKQVKGKKNENAKRVETLYLSGQNPQDWGGERGLWFPTGSNKGRKKKPAWSAFRTKLNTKKSKDIKGNSEKQEGQGKGSGYRGGLVI